MSIKTTNIQLTDLTGTTNQAMYLDASGNTANAEIIDYSTEDFNLVDANTWPTPYDETITNLDDKTLNVRIFAKHCFNIGIPDNSSLFPLDFITCNKIDFGMHLNN